MGESLRAHGEFPLRQTEYGIKPVSAAGGTIKLKDELKFTFDIVARPEGVESVGHELPAREPLSGAGPSTVEASNARVVHRPEHR